MIRVATADDLAQLVAIDAAGSQSPWTRAGYVEALARPTVHLALWPDAGLVVFSTVESEAELQQITVHPSRRRQGIGRALLSWAVDRWCSLGAEQAWLEVRDDNEAALTLYQSFGFREAGRRRRYYRDGRDALVMTWSGCS